MILEAGTINHTKHSQLFIYALIRALDVHT